MGVRMIGSAELWLLVTSRAIKLTEHWYQSHTVIVWLKGGEDVEDVKMEKCTVGTVFNNSTGG